MIRTAQFVLAHRWIALVSVRWESASCPLNQATRGLWAATWIGTGAENKLAGDPVSGRLPAAGCQMMSVVCRRSGKSGRVRAGRFGERQAARPRNRLEWDEIFLALR